MTCTAVLAFDAGPAAPALDGALRPESREAMLRARADVRAEDGRVVVRIEAEDVVALRTALNTYLRSATAVEGVLGALR